MSPPPNSIRPMGPDEDRREPGDVDRRVLKDAAQRMLDKQVEDYYRAIAEVHCRRFQRVLLRIAAERRRILESEDE